MKFTLIIILLLITKFSYSQEIEKKIGNVTIVMSKEIDSLIKLRSNKNIRKNNMVIGWRVNLDFSDNRSYLETIRLKFIKYHPEIETYISFENPRYQLMVGNFKDKNEAEELISIIGMHYKAIFLVRTMVFEEKDEYIREESTK